MNWGINQLLEDGGNDERETEREGERGENRERGEEREGRGSGEGRGQRSWVFGGNLRSTTRGTERVRERREEGGRETLIPIGGWGDA